MSSPEPTQNRQFLEMWSYTAPYFVPPMAASAAIIPAFPGFVAKSAQQLGEPTPKMTTALALKSFRAAPSIGVTVGTQMVVQNIMEKYFANDHSNKESILPMLTSSMVVGTLSAPPLAVFNGLTMGRTAMESLRALSVKQTGAIVSRETSFLFSLRVSGPLGEKMQEVYGESKAVEYGSAFTSGAIGSVIGHPADTALTFWQKGAKITAFSQLMRGAPAKAAATGVFSVCYKVAKEQLQETVS